jgi:hypothetical protein
VLGMLLSQSRKKLTHTPTPFFTCCCSRSMSDTLRFQGAVGVVYNAAILDMQPYFPERPRLDQMLALLARPIGAFAAQQCSNCSSLDRCCPGPQIVTVPNSIKQGCKKNSNIQANNAKRLQLERSGCTQWLVFTLAAAVAGKQ